MVCELISVQLAQSIVLTKQITCMKINIVLIISFVLCFSICTAQEQILYKQIDTVKLYMEVYRPQFIDSTATTPAMVFFFGGGWSSGERSQFIHHATYFSKRGLTCFLIDYRTKNKNNSTPFKSLMDAKTAIRFIRKNAKNFGIDTSKIIASGGSSGGQLAAASALIDAYTENTDDLSISCIPNALVLFNPVIDNGPGGYGYEKIGEAYRNFSPLHNIKKGAPPTIIFLGTNDKHIPVETAEYYKKVMEKVNSKCELRLYEGQGHGFFNHKNLEYFKKTIIETDTFLISLGYLEKEPIITIEKFY
jgi:acetyl esterase/lipase